MAETKRPLRRGGYFDMRDLAQVLEHKGPLPHPAEDKPQ
jgi:hypothetical protein